MERERETYISSSNQENFDHVVENQHCLLNLKIDQPLPKDGKSQIQKKKKHEHAMWEEG